MVRVLALAFPLLIAGCASAPDWADPTEWFDDETPEPSAQVDEDAAIPNLAEVHDEPRPASSDELRTQTAQGLAADRANAQYSDEALTAEAGVADTPAVPAAPSVSAATSSPQPAVAAVPTVPQAPQPALAPEVQAAPQMPQVAAVPQSPQVPAAAQVPTTTAAVPAYTAPPPPRQSVRAAVIYFAYGSAAIDAQDRAILSQIVALQQQRNAYIRVVGHASALTGNQLPEQHRMANFNISLKRANAVAANLVSLGVDRSRITSEARGDEQPIYHEFMPNGEAGNRRAEIFLEY